MTRRHPVALGHRARRAPVRAVPLLLVFLAATVVRFLTLH